MNSVTRKRKGTVMAPISKPVLGIFATIMIAFTAHAELAAPGSAGSADGGGASAELPLLKDDPMIKSLPDKSFRPGRANDKERCPGGRFLLGGFNSLIIYTKRNSEGVFFGAGENISLSEVTDQKTSAVRMTPGQGAVRCETTTNRGVVQEDGRVVVTEVAVEDCGGVKNETKSVFSVIRDDKGLLKVDFDRRSPKGDLKCEYLEGDVMKRPSPERPFLKNKKQKREGTSSSRRVQPGTWSI